MLQAVKFKKISSGNFILLVDKIQNHQTELYIHFGDFFCVVEDTKMLKLK